MAVQATPFALWDEAVALSTAATVQERLGNGGVAMALRFDANEKTREAAALARSQGCMHLIRPKRSVRALHRA